MTNLSLVNVIANCTTAFSGLGLLIHIFGDPDNSIWNNRMKAVLAKLGLSITTCGAVANCITLSAPPPTEVVLNVGIAVTFFWLNWWQFEMFKAMQESHNQLKNKKQTKRTPKKPQPKAKKTAQS
jgi:hypothetical protein